MTEEEIISFVVDAIIDDVVAWTETPGVDVEQLKDDLRRAFRYEHDGYRVAKALDDAGWDPNYELATILDDAFMHRARAMREPAA